MIIKVGLPPCKGKCRNREVCKTVVAEETEETLLTRRQHWMGDTEETVVIGKTVRSTRGDKGDSSEGETVKTKGSSDKRRKHGREW